MGRFGSTPDKKIIFSNGIYMGDETLSQANADVSAVSQIAGKYLTFALSKEQYGLQILKVQEIIGVINTTRVPGVPEHIKGVINLRGRIIPVVDLRLKFGLPEVAYDEKTCIIVVDAKLEGNSVAVGVIVDTVHEVTSFEANRIEPAPNYGANLETQFVVGMGRNHDDKVVILIDIDKALAGTEKLVEIVETSK